MTYADLGGIDNVLEDIKELIERPLQHPEVRLIICNGNATDKLAGRCGC